jgi:hypothetical protein
MIQSVLSNKEFKIMSIFFLFFHWLSSTKAELIAIFPVGSEAEITIHTDSTCAVTAINDISDIVDVVHTRR